jgi:hypothetical protein
VETNEQLRLVTVCLAWATNGTIGLPPPD